MENRLKVLSVVAILSLLSLCLVGCSNSTKSLSEVGGISQTKSEELFKYKGSYIGDNNAVGNIIGKLPANEYNGGFSLHTDKEPYSIKVNYKVNTTLGEEAYYKFWKDKKVDEVLEKNAVILLALIQNAETVEFNVEDIGEKSYKYHRENLEKKYGKDLKSLFKDSASIESFINS